MALSDLTFKLYTDSGLTTPYTGTSSLVHETDQSDNPQVIGPLYFGSTDSSAQLEATSNPGVDQITLTPTVGLSAWQASTAYSLGDRVIPVTPNGYVYEITTAGTTDSGEPTWPTTLDQTVVDNTAVWNTEAATHALTEVELSLDGAAYNSAGTALNLGTTLTGGSGNAITVYIRVTNAVTSVTSNTNFEDIIFNINEVQETA